MANACDSCGRPFGLIRHRHFRKQFCSATCKAQYRSAVAVLADERRLRAARLSEAATPAGAEPVRGVSGLGRARRRA